MHHDLRFYQIHSHYYYHLKSHTFRISLSLKSFFPIYRARTAPGIFADHEILRHQYLLIENPPTNKTEFHAQLRFLFLLKKEKKKKLIVLPEKFPDPDELWIIAVIVF